MSQPTTNTLTHPNAAEHELGAIVRLEEYVGSKSKQSIVYRITSVPDPKARKKAERECYGAEPITGGRGIFAYGWMLVPGSAADKAKADATPRVETPRLGWVVETTCRLRGFRSGSRLVVIGIKDDKASIAVLDGDGQYWPSVPISTLTRVDA